MANTNYEKRSEWKGKWAFIIAAAGSAVGLGNLWKFPYITEDNNGGAFVLIYLLCILLIGLPILIAETMIGKSTNADLVSTFDKLGKPKWKIIGWVGVITSFIILSYYSVVAGWAIGHFISSLRELFSSSYQPLGFGDYVGDPLIQIGFHILFMIITVFVVMKGIGRIENVLKWLMAILAVFLLSLAIYSLFFINVEVVNELGEVKKVNFARRTFSYLFSPNFSEITSFRTLILEAVGHAFFTLSIGFGAMIAYGRYLSSKDENESVVNSATWIAVIDTVVAIIACLVMFPIIFMLEQKGMEMDSGIGMLFTTIKGLLPSGNIIKVIFFLLVGFAALSSAISLLEIVVSSFEKKMNLGRSKTTIIAGFFIGLFGIMSALSNGADKNIGGIFSNTGISIPNHKKAKKYFDKETILENFSIVEDWNNIEATIQKQEFIKQYFENNPDEKSNQGIITFGYSKEKDKVVRFKKKGDYTGVLDILDYIAVNWLLPFGALLISIFVGWVIPADLKRKEFLKGNEKRIGFYKIWNFIIKYFAPFALIIILLYAVGIL